MEVLIIRPGIGNQWETHLITNIMLITLVKNTSLASGLDNLR